MAGARRPLGVRPKSGFSILEVLLALALSTALLAGLFSALSLFMRSFDSGRTQVEEAQLARSLLRQIARDLRSAVVTTSTGGEIGEKSLALPTDFLAPEESAAEPRISDGPVRATVFSPLRKSSPAPARRAMRLAGTSNRLDLCVRDRSEQDSLAALFVGGETTSAEPFAHDAGKAPLATAGRMRQVSYFCYDSTDPERMLAQETNGEQSTTADGKTSVAPAGLIRREQPWSEPSTESTDSKTPPSTESPPAAPETDAYSAPTASAAATAPPGSTGTRSRENRPTEISELEQRAESLTPEVVQVAFRYFDGSTWYSSWDSDADGGLPVAVDVAFWLAEPAVEARRPRRAQEQRTEVDVTTSSPNAATQENTIRTGTSSGRSSEDYAGAGSSSAEALPDYRLLVYLPLATPRREANANRALSSPDELNAPLPTGPMPPTLAPPAPPAPTRRNSIPSFFRPPVPTTSRGAP